MSKLPIPFGNPNTYAGHSGVDYPVPRGSIIRASGPGTVVTRARNDAGGFYVFVKYDAIDFPVGYHHMDSHNGVPVMGTRVQEGSQLGYVGSLGARSTGPHLHSEVSGHRTTAGYWQFFDRDRVVGSGSGASAAGSSKPAYQSAAKPNVKDESEEDAMKILLLHIEHANGTDPWYVVDFAAGTAARMREGIQLDIARKYGQIVEVAGVQPESAIRGLRIVNG